MKNKKEWHCFPEQGLRVLVLQRLRTRSVFLTGLSSFYNYLKRMKGRKGQGFNNWERNVKKIRYTET